MKPLYLYHGSQYYLEKIVPRPANGACEKESLLAIYAAETLEEVIPFALPIRWYPDNPTGKKAFNCSDGRTELIYGSLDPDGVGYVYKLRADTFEKIDEWQWVSQVEVVPEEVLQIKVRDYLETVSFSEEALRIQEELYGDRRESCDVKTEKSRI